MKRLMMAIVVAGLGVWQSAAAICDSGSGGYCATQVVNGVAWCYRTNAGSNVQATLQGRWVYENGHSFYRPVIDSATRGAVAVPATLGGHAVAYICSGAFANCTNLTSITIPAGVEYVDSSAFDGCDALMLFSVASGNANYASKGGLLLDKKQTTVLRCPAALTSVTIPSTVTTISSYAFSGCSALSSLDIPPHVKTIGYQAFKGCENLRRVTGGYGLVSVENDAFDDTALVRDAEAGPVRVGNIWVAYSGDLPSELVIPEGVSGAAFSLGGVSELTLPSTVKASDAVHGFDGYAIHVPSLGYWLAFHANNSSCMACCGSSSFYRGDGYDLYFGDDIVADVAIPGSITNVPSRCFYRCWSLNSVSLGEGVRSIGSQAFQSCESLDAVSIPSTLVTSFDSAFDECPNLSAFVVSSDSPRFATHGDILYDKTLTTLIRCPRGKEKVTLPPTVTRIDAGAFEGCDRLEEKVTLPSSVREVGYGAFSGCAGLRTVLGGSGVREVGNDVFAETPFLEEAADGPVSLGSTWVAYVGEVPETLVVPEGVTDIGFNIDNVTDLTLPSTFQPDWLNFYADVLRVPSVAFWLREGGNISFSGGGGCCDCGSSTSTGYYLFAKDEQVTDVTIPGSMGRIPDSLFHGCLSLTSVTVDEGVTVIGESALSGCANLSEMQLPKSLRRIGDYAFDGCSQLDFELPSFIDAIGEGAFRDTLVLENAVAAAAGGVVYIGNWCFGFYDPDDEDSPSTITVKNGTRGIASSAFEYVRASKVTLPASLVAIEDYAFAETELTSVTLPTGLKRLDRHAFAGSKLASLPKLPSTLEEVGCGVFRSCEDGVTPAYAKLPKGWIVQDGWLLGYKAYDYVYDAEEDAWYSDEEDEDEYPERLAVPSGVKHIAAGDGEDFYGLVELTLPNGLETIGEDAFHYAELNEVVFPASVTRLGSGAFAWADGPITFLGRPPEIELDDEGDGPFEEACLGYFVAGTPGWTNGMTFAGLTMIARDDLMPPVTPAEEGVAFESVNDVECAGGESISIPIACTSESAVTYKTVGLPTGVACEAYPDAVGGYMLWYSPLLSAKTPTPGKYRVTATATNVSRDTDVAEFLVTVSNLTSAYIRVANDYGMLTPNVPMTPISFADAVDFERGDTLKVTDLPPGLKYDATKHELTGTPTKPGEYTLSFTAAAYPEAGTVVRAAATAFITVKPFPEIAVALEGERVLDALAAGCKVTGAGNYKAGTKVNLKATAAKGWVFAGWSGVDGLSELAVLNPTLAYTMGTNDYTEVGATFIEQRDDRLYVGDIWELGDESVSNTFVCVKGDAVLTNLVACLLETRSLPTVTVTGLPSGLSFDKSTFLIKGVPTKVGVFYATVSAKNAGGYVFTRILRMAVKDDDEDPIPEDVTLKNEAEIDFVALDGLTTGDWCSPAAGVGFLVETHPVTGAGVKAVTVSGQPTGLTATTLVDGESGTAEVILTGTPTKVGRFTVKVSVTYLDNKRATSECAVIVTDGGSRWLDVASFDETLGTVTGSGVYSSGATVKLSAKATTGNVFGGWYEDEVAVFENLALMDNVDYRTANVSFVFRPSMFLVPETPVLWADFGSKLGDVEPEITFGEAGDWTIEPSESAVTDIWVDSFSLPKVTVTGAPKGVTVDAVHGVISYDAAQAAAVIPGWYTLTVKAVNQSNQSTVSELRIFVANKTSEWIGGLSPAPDAYPLMVGVAVPEDLIVPEVSDALTLTTGPLPSGLKFVKETDPLTRRVTGYRIEGVPTKAGTYTVTFTATGKVEGLQVKEVATITLDVADLPAWAQGTFNGVYREVSEDGSATNDCGTLNMTVSAAGKVSGRLLSGGKSYTLSSASLESFDSAKGMVSASVDIAWATGSVETYVVDIVTSKDNQGIVTVYGLGACGAELVQNVWLRKDLASEAPVFATGVKQPVMETEDGLVCKFGAKGVVTLSGLVGSVRASGSAQVLLGCSDLADGANARLPVYLANRSFAGGAYCKVYDIVLTDSDGDGKIDGVEVINSTAVP